MSSKRIYPRTQNLMTALLFLGDIFFAYCGLTAAYLLRVKSPLREIGVNPIQLNFESYQPLLWLGTMFLVVTYYALGLYDTRHVLRPHRSFGVILRGTFVWLLCFLGFSLTFKFEPAISRIFVALSCITCTLSLVGWRHVLYMVISNSSLRDRLVQRVAIIGWNEEAEQLVENIRRDPTHPYELVGVISTKSPAEESERNYLGEHRIGEFGNLENVLSSHPIDIAVVADLSLSKEQIFHTVEVCERRYVKFKIVPGFFQIFVSSLQMQTISTVPILGHEPLPITTLSNQLVKRSVDILGGLVGLLGSLPIMITLALIIKKQSPGPIIYRQIRTGRHGKPFTIYKLRSMRLDAEKAGAQWCVADDPRRLPVGAFMRKWNLDEVPQFWNVLIGDMSLVGPRPERPELIEKFEREIPHYNPRHEVRPGLTGWAQVNGLRGNTSLVERVKYDLYYIENWNIWFDFQIMFLTFFKRDNAY